MANDLVVAGNPLATAHNWITRALEPDSAGDYRLLQGYAPLDPALGPALVVAEMKLWAQYSLSSMSQICAAAQAGSEEADQALRELINEYNDQGLRLPAPLAAYSISIMSRLQPHRPRGRKRSSHIMRDIVIAVLVGELVGHHGLKPTRRQPPPLSAHPSACSLVAQALRERGIRTLNERAVEKVWEKNWRIIGDFRRASRAKCTK